MASARGRCAEGLGILAASYTVTFKQGTGVVGLFTTILTVGSGSYFPVTVLPSWSQGLAKLSPLTLALNAARGYPLRRPGAENGDSRASRLRARSSRT